MSKDRNVEKIARWLTLVEGRAQTIGKTEAAETGEDFATSGDLQLDSDVASFLLEPVQSRLPNYGYIAAGGEVVMGRSYRPATQVHVRPIPLLLFALNWADTAPGLSWPESYYVTFVPQLNARIVTASSDNDELWGSTDIAIGWCKPVGRADWGTKKIITGWWRRGCGVMMPWQSFWAAGLITQLRAERWRREVFGSLNAYDG